MATRPKGSASAAIRRLNGPARQKFRTVMREFGQRKLRSASTGQTVTNPSEAVAIALSEARRARRKAA